MERWFYFDCPCIYSLNHHYLRYPWPSQASTMGSLGLGSSTSHRAECRRGMRKEAAWADEGTKWELDGGCGDPGEVTHQQALRTLSLQ